MVSTALPLSLSTDAMLIALLPGTRSPVGLIVPLRSAKGKAMPQPDPVPSPTHSMMRRFWRIFRLLAVLSIVIAAIGVWLVTRGAGEVHASLIIATALGIGLTVLVGTGLMTLVFISTSTGHDESVSPAPREDNDKP